MKKLIEKVVIGLGSNVGDRVGYINGGINMLKEKGKVITTSFLYETKPMYLEK